jgi:hypothetical protein
MRIQLPNQIETEFFHLENAIDAERIATKTGGQVYCWKTAGKSNWLEKRFSIVDVLGLVVMPRGLSDFIEMPDDENGE